MSDERLRILKMVEEGKISAEDASRLLEALREESPAPPASPAGEHRPRWLRIRVTEANGSRVQVNVPVRLLDVALRIAARTGALDDDEGQQVLQALQEAIATGEVGRIVEVVDEEDGDRVEIFVE
ncbi:MAG: hypothetical protein GXO37_01930 [Chloroflexi bacterium]|nr:hypothetical protein [Chloroflexota bacterium]